MTVYPLPIRSSLIFLHSLNWHYLVWLNTVIEVAIFVFICTEKTLVLYFPKWNIITLGIDDIWTADLFITSNYSYQNDNCRYTLNVTEYASSRPLKNKHRIDVSNVFEHIKDAIKIDCKSQKLLHTDKRLEFKNKEFNSLLKNMKLNDIRHRMEWEPSIMDRYNWTLIF